MIVVNENYSVEQVVVIFVNFILAVVYQSNKISACYFETLRCSGRNVHGLIAIDCGQYIIDKQKYGC